MKLLIAVPSKNRFDVLQKNALNWIKDINYDWRVFVEPQDYEKYSSFIGPNNLIVIDKNNQGLGYVKNIIKEYGLKNGYTHVFKVDDDTRGFTDYRRRLPDLEMVDLIKGFLAKFETVFNTYKEVKAIGFPYSFEMYEKTEWQVVKRLQSNYIVDIKEWYTNPNVSTFEDMASSIYIISRYNLVLRYGLSGIVQGIKVGGGSGGCQDFDRFQQAKIELEELRKIYPPLRFKKVDKPWKIEPDLSSVIIPSKK